MAELKMTRDEAESLYNENPPKSVTFSSYYKYSFSFSGETEALTVSLSFGGSSDDIYREEVNTEPVPVSQMFDGLSRNFNFVSIVRKSDGASFAEFFDDGY